VDISYIEIFVIKDGDDFGGDLADDHLARKLSGA
jgi:hypothetical protein